MKPKRKKYESFDELYLSVNSKLQDEYLDVWNFLQLNQIHFTDLQYSAIIGYCKNILSVIGTLNGVYREYLNSKIIKVELLNPICTTILKLYNVSLTNIYNITNWKFMCYNIKTFILSNTPFNILNIKITDCVNDVITGLYNVINVEYGKHIQLFITEVPTVDFQNTNNIQFSQYVVKHVNVEIIEKNKTLFDVIKCFEEMLLFHDTNQIQNRYDFLRSFGHHVFDKYNNLINTNSMFDIENLKMSNTHYSIFMVNPKIITVCENIRNYIYKNRLKLSSGLQQLFNQLQFKSIKCPLKEIVNSTEEQNDIDKIVTDINDIVERAYYFIKLYVLHYYNNKENDGLICDFINFDFISMCVRAVTINDARGSGFSVENEILLSKLNKFYDDYVIDIFPEKIVAIGYSQILNSCKQQMEIAFKNNVNRNYFNILKKYVSNTFKECNKDTYSKLKKEDKKQFTKELNHDIQTIITDILENTYKSDSKYHEWINKFKPLLVPLMINGDIHFDISNNPSKYFKYMLNLNMLFETDKRKLYNCFPMDASNVPSNITIDTSTITNIFIKTDKEQDKFAITKFLKDNTRCMYFKIWKMKFNMNNKIFKLNNNYLFNNQIQTDGFSVTISFVNKDLYGVSLEKQRDKDKKEEFEYIDNLGLDETTRDKNESRSETEKNNLKNHIANLKKDYNFVYVDPGRNPDLLYCCDDNKNYFKYTTKQRIHQLGTITFRKRLRTEKKKHLNNSNVDIKEIENKMKLLSVKTCNFTNFKKILIERLQYSSILKDFYKKVIFRKMRFWSYINTKRSESMLVNNIKLIFSSGKKHTIPNNKLDKTNVKSNNKKILLVYGNWNRISQMKGTMSVPQIGLKRMLHKEFKILNFDEFRTSCMDNNTGNKCINAVVKVGKNAKKTKQLHSVLVSEIQQTDVNVKSVKLLKRYQNRNRHAVENFKLIVDGYEKNGERPYYFTHKYTMPEIKKFEIKTIIVVVEEGKQEQKSDVAVTTKHSDLLCNNIDKIQMELHSK